MKVTAVVMLRRTGRVVEEGVVVMEREVPEASEDRDGDTVEERIIAAADRKMAEKSANYGPELMRMAESCKVNREDFLKHYRGSELDPNWLDRVGRLPGKGWKVFVIKHPDDIAKVRGPISAVATGARLPVAASVRV